MPEAVAHRLAEAEGLSLVLAPGNASGFKGVNVHHGVYVAAFSQGGKQVNLGSFSSAAEAALAYARHLAAPPPAPALASAPSSRAPIQAAVIEHYPGGQPQALLMQSSAVPPMTGVPRHLAAPLPAPAPASAPSRRAPIQAAIVEQHYPGGQQMLYGTQHAQPAAHMPAGRPLLLTPILYLIRTSPQPQS